MGGLTAATCGAVFSVESNLNPVRRGGNVPSPARLSVKGRKGKQHDVRFVAFYWLAVLAVTAEPTVVLPMWAPRVSGIDVGFTAGVGSHGPFTESTRTIPRATNTSRTSGQLFHNKSKIQR